MLRLLLQHARLELNPRESLALYTLGLIQMAQGEIAEAKKSLHEAIKANHLEVGAYQALSMMLETKEEAKNLINSAKRIDTNHLTPLKKSFIGFTIANCLHSLKKYDLASKYLKIANESKLIAFPSNASNIKESITISLKHSAPKKSTIVDQNSGKERIFIVGMPRSGSTLLETILSMSPVVKGLGEKRSLAKAITKAKQLNTCHTNYSCINELYTEIEPIDITRYKYTVDKQLYNFLYIFHIINYMPGAKIIHCQRNPMDNILSMYRSNLSAGNNYTSNLEDLAKVLAAQATTMNIQKQRYPGKIYTFDYDSFVNNPEPILKNLLIWLSL